MSLDLRSIRAALTRRDRVARVVLTSVRGSTPREVGTAMLVWADAKDAGGQSGTIGGGTLEWEAAAAARDVLAQGSGRVMTKALGPELGQCCGGAVGLAIEIWDAALLARAEAAGARFTRALSPAAGPCPDGMVGDGLVLSGLWLSEPRAEAGLPLWIWGAGHVGRAVVPVMAPLPGWGITWADTGADRFPDQVPDLVDTIWAADPARLMAHAPRDACHLILTHSHALDLALCDAALRHGFTFCGLIGSATKKARFAKRLEALGHSPTAITRITCPIGTRDLGKHPAQIALGVALELLQVQTHQSAHPAEEKTGT